MNTIRDYYALFIIILLYLALIEIILPYSALIRALFCIILNYSALFSTIRKLLCSILHYYALFLYYFYTTLDYLHYPAWTIYTILHYFLFCCWHYSELFLYYSVLFHIIPTILHCFYTIRNVKVGKQQKKLHNVLHSIKYFKQSPCRFLTHTKSRSRLKEGCAAFSPAALCILDSMENQNQGRVARM